MSIIRQVQTMTLDDIQDYANIQLVRAEKGSIPTQPGVYCHIDSTDRAVLYIGSASGSVGLKRRLGDEIRWIEESMGSHTDHAARRSANAAVIAGLAEHATVPYYLVTATTDEAKNWERRLVQLCVVLTGAPPLLRGWNLRGASLDAFRWAVSRGRA